MLIEDGSSPRSSTMVVSSSDGLVQVGLEDDAHQEHLFCRSLCISTVLIPHAVEAADLIVPMSSERVAQFLHQLSRQTLEARVRRSIGTDFVLCLDASEVLNSCASAVGLDGKVDEVSLHMSSASTARSFAVASMAIMMAGHPRLGASCGLGLLGGDLLRLVCDLYRVRLYDSRADVW